METTLNAMVETIAQKTGVAVVSRNPEHYRKFGPQCNVAAAGMLAEYIANIDETISNKEEAKIIKKFFLKAADALREALVFEYNLTAADRTVLLQSVAELENATTKQQNLIAEAYANIKNGIEC